MSFLPRELPLDLLIFTCVLLSALLFYVFYEKGGKIQKIVLDKKEELDLFVVLVLLISFMRLSYYTLNNTMIYVSTSRSLLVYYVVENWRLRQWLKTTN